jgi:hypothetical protein
MEIRDEAGGEFIYGARNNNAEGIKFNIANGEIVMRLGFPKESGLKLEKFNPTAITVAPNGDIFLSDGYASNYIFKFDKTGKYLKHFGTKGNGLKEFNTAHGMTLDTRYEPPRLLICDRNHTPKGRLLHYSLDGEYIDEVITGLGMPTSVAIQGDWLFSTRAIRSWPSWVTIPIPPRAEATISHKNNGSRVFSAARTVPTGIKMVICTFKIGTYPVAS